MEKTNPGLANDSTVDNNNMVKLILIALMLKTLKLINMILNFCYFIGLGWLIMCRVVQSVMHGEDYEGASWNNTENPNYFITKFELYQKTSREQAIIAVYFAFTSFTTVGFGDYYPVSDLERMVGAFLLLFGVAIFSFIMGKFIEMVDQIKVFNRGLDDGDSL